jgi:hypothetical protein
MSQENVETVRANFEVWKPEDMQPFLSCTTPR